MSLGVYAWTVAPNVTLLDSGEFLVAAQQFGVPHPTGYPLWTMLAWMFSLLPLGNDAWEINLLSGVLGALAVGLSGGLMRSFLRWLFPAEHRASPGLVSLAAFSSSLLFAFSFPMWSQSVITEVYSLHALLIGAFLAALYGWIRRPGSDGLLGLVFFLLTLAFSNHQLSLCLAPLPIVAVFLLRRDIFWDLLVAGLVTAAGFFLLMGWLSGDFLVAKASVRFAYCVGAVFVLVLYWRRLRLVKYLAVVVLAVAAGLLPYAYLPLASSTNPPMNWGYTRELVGLFHSFNRSQYSGPLTEQGLRAVGKMVGVPQKKDLAPPPINNPAAPPEKSLFELAASWTPFFFDQLARSFTIFGVAAYLVSLGLLVMRRKRPEWTWGLALHLAFLLAACLQPFVDRAQTDVSGWWVQMPYHTYTFLIFSLLCSAGLVIILGWACAWWKPLRPLKFCLLFLPLAPLVANHGECSQRGRWFGWMFGHDMLKDLPPGSVLVGGSDPGRFIPTYMIFGESPQDARHKRDPDFDRRDLFIITQNALGEPRYMQYLRDQYTDARPPVNGAFERWLGRESIYPRERLILPTAQEMAEAVKAAAMPDPSTGRPLEGSPAILTFSAVLRWIWERNKDWHDFFIEESFPMVWTYDYAVPSGLCYRMSPVKLTSLPPEAVRRDMEFWAAYKTRLLGDPHFSNDLDARRTFSRLRNTMGNIYRHRGMNLEAERAFREAIELYPADGAATSSLMGLLWDREEFTEPVALCQKAYALDPNNEALKRLLRFAESRQELQDRIIRLASELRQRPTNRNALIELVMLHAGVGDLAKANQILSEGFQRFPNDPEFLRFAAAHDVINGQPLNSLAPALRLAQIEPLNPANQYILAHAWYSHTNMPEFYKAMQAAIEAGGVPMQEMFSKDSYFDRLREEVEFRRIMGKQGPTHATEIPAKGGQ